MGSPTACCARGQYFRPPGRAGGTPSQTHVGRCGEQHSLSGNEPPTLSPKTPADGQMLPESQGLGQQVGNVPTEWEKGLFTCSLSQRETSKRVEPSSCCSCAAKPADGNIGPSMATCTGGLRNGMAQGCWAPQLSSTQWWQAGSSPQQVMALPSPSPACRWTHQLSPSCCACRWHVGNSGLRTQVRLCQTTLTPDKPSLPKPAQSKAQQTVRAVKGSTSLPMGFGAKTVPATQVHRWAQAGHGAPCASLEMGPLQNEVQTHF